MSNYNYKVTYHLGSVKRSMILHQEYEGGFRLLCSDIQKLLFKDLGYPEKKIRLYWIDNAGDEIEILCDKDIECLKDMRNSNSVYPHIHVANMEEDLIDGSSKTKSTAEPISTTSSATNQAKVPPADGSYEFAVHEHVECDACLMAPIVGFRYKCIQCPNYDLCQNCESKHVHSEHMMVRMPTNNCPSVVETYITGRSSTRKHGKRSRTTCPLIKNGLSVILDDNIGDNANAAGGVGENAEQEPTTSNGKERHHGRRHHRRHQRNNFLAHLYDMMHDLAEGGGAAAAAHATGSGEEASSSTKTTTTTTTSSGPQTTTTEPNIIAAQIAAQQAHESAVKAAEIASKVAHETAVQAAKNITTNMFAKQTVDTNDANAKETTTDKVDATTSPRENTNNVPVTPSPSLETLSQILDPVYMRTGIQILNNFSDMFAKMLDPLDNEIDDSNKKATTTTASSSSSINTANLRKNSTTSSKSSSVASNLNSMNVNEILAEKQQNNEESKQTESDVSSHIEIEDMGSDSESDSVSESFIKLDAPKEANTTTKTATASNSAETTPPQSLNKSNVMDFAQLSANLKAHIDEEATKKNTVSTSVETGVAATEQVAKTTNTSTTTATTSAEPMVVATNSINTSTTASNEERRAVPVYHAAEHINNAVLAMMAMGFSNEGAWLTQLLESVNGNIPDALDLMSVAQRGGGR